MSVKTRFLTSVASNVVRSMISFFSGLLIARGLNPSGYGNMMFLLGSFVAIRTFLDMGSSSSFYTFISQRPRSQRFYLYYYGWLAMQFVITVLLITVLMPDAMLNKVWLGHSRTMILLAFAASFMQQQIWQTLSQIGEAARQTVRIQLIAITLGVVHLIIISLLLAFNSMSIVTIFFILIGEYLLAALLGGQLIRKQVSALITDTDNLNKITLKSTSIEYWTYCKPLIAISLVGFLYDFADRWMLQRFAGADQQGFYQIASQFAGISLLATSSILSVFWKEIAEAHEQQNRERVAALYQKASKGLVMFGAIISGFLIPWSAQIVSAFLGKAYIMATPILMIMFFFPIHQSMGQIGGTMFLASGKTYEYMIITVFFMLISLPLSYVVQAPHTGSLIPGLGLGALGMALKMVLLNIISVNAMAWVIARNFKFRYDWLFQVVGIGSVIALGYASKTLSGVFWDLNVDLDTVKLIYPFLFSLFIYLFSVFGLIWSMPWLTGLERNEIRRVVAKGRALLLATK